MKKTDNHSLETINDRLDRVKIRAKGDRLYLRATLPPKDGTGKPRQYEISTGLFNDGIGLKAALGKAQKLESDLIFERFRWEDWLPTATPGNHLTVEEALKRHEDWYWETRKQTPTKIETYNMIFGRWFKTLPLDEALTLPLLKRELIRYEADSYQRKNAYSAYRSLAKFCGMDWPHEFTALKGRYKTGDRKIPTDQEILDAALSMPSEWQWLVGMLAAYGLRPHELFTLDRSRFPIVKVHRDTKTGERLVWPIWDKINWIEALDLETYRFPNFQINGKETNRKIGFKVSCGFRSRKIAFTPYALRDAYAIRCAVIGVDSAIAARLMGHTISEHCKSYLRFIDEVATNKILTEKLLGKV